MKKLLIFILCVCVWSLNAQDFDKRAQFPKALQNSYFNICPGYIHYPFTPDHAEPGRSIDEVQIPHGAARVIIGHEFSDYFSVQLSVMRPVKWVRFNGWEGLGEGSGSVWINIWSITAKPELPFSEKFSVYGEFGVSTLSRHGFDFRGSPMVTSENYIGWITGGGAQYALNNRWDVNLNFAYLPSRKSVRQPYTMLASLGIKHNLRQLKAEKVKAANESGYIFPKQKIQIGAAHDFVGYGFNSLFYWTNDNKLAIPIFWQGDILTKHGIAISYQKNVFHTKKSFSLDWGASFTYSRSQLNNTPILAISVFPVLKFWLLRTNPFDFYFDYSAAAPCFITPSIIDGLDTGENFTFQDFLGFGFYFGATRNLNVEFKIIHYSNGGMFDVNPGVDLPLMLNLGYAF